VRPHIRAAASLAVCKNGVASPGRTFFRCDVGPVVTIAYSLARNPAPTSVGHIRAGEGHCVGEHGIHTPVTRESAS
jgi:hypothetical protein